MAHNESPDVAEATFFGRITGFLFGQNRDAGDDYGRQPLFEALEPRILLSGTPLFDPETDSAGDPGLYATEAAAVYVPLSTETGAATDTATATASVAAPVVKITGPSASVSAIRKDTYVNITVSDTDSTDISWTVTLINNDTGVATDLASGTGAISSSTRVSTIAVADYPDGPYTLLLSAEDESGNRAEVTRTFNIDRQAPEVRIESTERLEAGQVIWFTVVGEDVSPLGAKTLKINGSTVRVDANGRGSYTFAAPGTYTLEATVRDSAGNMGTGTRVVMVTENTDFIAPTVTITSPEAGSWHGVNVTDIRATIQDVDSDDVQWTVRMQRVGATTATTLATGTGKTDNEVVANFKSSSLAAGTFIIEIEAIDPAGNSTIVTREVNISRALPSVRLDAIPADSGSYINFSKTITGSVSCSDCPTELIEWTVRITHRDTGEDWRTFTGTGQPADGVFGRIDPAAMTSGVYRVTLTATSAGGNQKAYTITINVDATPPVFSGVEYYTEGRYFRFLVHAADDYSEKVRTRLTALTGGAGVTGTANLWGGLHANGTGAYTRHYLLSIHDGHGNEVAIGMFRVVSHTGGSLTAEFREGVTDPDLFDHGDDDDLIGPSRPVIVEKG